MKYLIAVVLVMFGIGIFTPAPAQSEQEISVKVKRTASARGGLRIQFVEMVEDSRCPTDTNCIWAGNAKIKIRVTKNGRSKVLELNSGLEPRIAAFAGYRFELKALTPEPRSNIRIDPNGYIAKIKVSRAS